MGQVTKQVSLESNVSDTMDAITGLISAIKAKKLDLATELGVVIRLVNEVPQIPTDFKNDLPGCVNSIALGVSQIVSALLT